MQFRNIALRSEKSQVLVVHISSCCSFSVTSTGCLLHGYVTYASDSWPAENNEHRIRSQTPRTRDLFFFNLDFWFRLHS